MVKPGDRLVNEVTGESITFVETADQTGGEWTLIEVEVAPGGGVPMAHVHPYQTETFEVLSGELSMTCGRDSVVAGPGDFVRVAAGQVHKFRNATAYPVRFRCTVAPAREFERFIETMFALAADGKLNKRGLPSPLRLAAIANGAFDDSRAPYIPARVQKAALALGALFGRALGYGPTYESPRPQGELVPATA